MIINLVTKQFSKLLRGFCAMNQESKYINVFGEFRDKELECEFFNQYVNKVINYIRKLVMLLGIINTLFIIPDYMLVKDAASIFRILSVRVVFILLIILLYIRCKYISDNRKLLYWITAYEIICILSFLYIFLQYEEPNYLIQALGVMIIVQAVYMVPNRWLNKILVSILVWIVFSYMSYLYIGNIKFSEFSAGIVYIGLNIILSSIISYKNHCYRRIQYINNKELSILSVTDYLTGAYNREKLNEELMRWINISKKNQDSLIVAILDLDSFKEINDTYGHLTGDSVLRSVADIIRGSIRSTDIFARWGGDEFVLLFPETDETQAKTILEDIRVKIEAYKFDRVTNQTCSFGMTMLTDKDDSNSFLHRADQMLYSAKRDGKNRIITECI